jgi:hypothetical protein
MGVHYLYIVPGYYFSDRSRRDYIERVLQGQLVPASGRILEHLTERAIWPDRQVNYMAAAQKGPGQIGDVNFAAAKVAGRTDLQYSHDAPARKTYKGSPLNTRPARDPRRA